jgi:hypothetical protein
VTYRTPSTWTQRVLVLDANTGQIRKDVQTPALAAGADRSQLVSGLDWLGHKTIRYTRGQSGRRQSDPAPDPAVRAASGRRELLLQVPHEPEQPHIRSSRTTEPLVRGCNCARWLAK